MGGGARKARTQGAPARRPNDLTATTLEVWGRFAQTVSKRARLHLRDPENGEPLLAKPAHDRVLRHDVL